MIELANDRWFPVVNLGLATSAATLWYLTSGRVGWPLLVVILVPWLMRIAAGHFPFRRSRLDGWLLVFVATAVLGTLTAYDPQLARGKFWVLIGAAGVYFAIASLSRRDTWLLAGATGPVGMLLATYFVLSNNWRQWPADIALFNRIGLAWMSVRPSFPLPVLHPNTLAGMMALVLPFTLAFGIYSWHRRKIRWAQAAALSALVTLLGFIFTSSIGAWLALSVGLSCWFLWRLSAIIKRRLVYTQEQIFSGLLLLLLLTSIVLLMSLLGSGVAQEGSATRLGLARQTLYLIEDFALTGSGLATFPALYAQYIQITPSFFAAYSNFYFDIWLEQGFFALVALIVMMGVSFWLLFRRALAKPAAAPRRPYNAHAKVNEGTDEAKPRKRRKQKKLTPHEMSLFRWAAFVSLMVMTLHGLIDNALYGAQGSPLLFFSPAMVILVTRRRESAAVVPSAERWRRIRIGLSVTAVLFAGIFFGFRETVQAQWYANLGALAQAQAELTRWPTNQWDRGENLARYDLATSRLEQALALNPRNRTANYRLGLIAMVKRDYNAAVNFLTEANALSGQNRGITKSLGYSLAWQGEFSRAVQFLSQIPESRAEMIVYSDWWQRQNRFDLANRASEMAAMLENVTLMRP